MALSVIASAIANPNRAQQHGCADTRDPKHLPAINALLDSASVVAELAALQGPRGEMLFSLFFNDGDSLPVILSLKNGDPQALQVLNRAVRPQKPSDVWAVRVRISPEATPVLTIGRAQYCPPALEARLGDHFPTTGVVQVEPGDRMPPRGRARITVEVTVKKDGTPSRVRLVEGSGLRDLDEQLVREFEMRRYQPALLDGVPIEGVFRSDGYSPRR